jgi:adenine/guanine phosphoribosyltransferase-like PRPP-binding protein
VTEPDLRALIRDIPDFPAAGILFKDITPLLLDHNAVRHAVGQLAAWAKPLEVDYVVAAEARGFILGAALALELDAGFVPARKPGKLPSETVSAEYILEYGVDALEMHADALADGARVLRPAGRRGRWPSSSRAWAATWPASRSWSSWSSSRAGGGSTATTSTR